MSLVLSWAGGLLYLRSCKTEALLKRFLEHGPDPNLGPPLIPQSDSVPSLNAGSTLNCAASVGIPEFFRCVAPGRREAREQSATAHGGSWLRIFGKVPDDAVLDWKRRRC